MADKLVTSYTVEVCRCPSCDAEMRFDSARLAYKQRALLECHVCTARYQLVSLGGNHPEALFRFVEYGFKTGTNA